MQCGKKWKRLLSSTDNVSRETIVISCKGTPYRYLFLCIQIKAFLCQKLFPYILLSDDVLRYTKNLVIMSDVTIVGAKNILPLHRTTDVFISNEMYS